MTINGSNFDPVAGNNQVAFNGVSALVTSATATTLTAIVPVGATTGLVTITTAGGTATSAAPFTVVNAAPIITSFSPDTGHLGNLITIVGTGFDPIPGNNQVTIGGASAPVQSSTGTELVVSVPFAATTGPISVTTSGGTSQSATNFTIIPVTALTVSPENATLPVGSSQPFRATATFGNQTQGDVSAFVTWGSSNAASATVSTNGITQGVAIGTANITGTLGTFSEQKAVQVIADDGSGPLPTDPSLVAPPLDPTVVTTMFEATEFLFTGANPIQTGVAPGTIEPKRVAVIRGIVRDRNGFPIPGVTISILDHPEFGQTRTRTDGMYDLAVNGGKTLTVTFNKIGLIGVQRVVDAKWRNYGVSADVIMIPFDTQVTSVDLAAATTIQVARGGVVTDQDGTRQATVFFNPGTQATMTLPGGGTQPLTTLNVRATEFTVEPGGLEAMPAALPPISAYTYAVDLSIDDAEAAGASIVNFSEPVYLYVENFIGMDNGVNVPNGVYDEEKGHWVAEENGRVLEIVSITNGMADLDVDRTPGIDTGTALIDLGITDAERTQLATLYSPGTSLWRTPQTHFSTPDLNFNLNLFVLWTAGVPPNVENIRRFLFPDGCEAGGSVLRCEEQTLGELVPVVGTPFTLHYQSDRVRGRGDRYTLQIPLSEDTISPLLKRIELDLTVAGRSFHFEFGPGTNLTHTFTWDGKDAYGRVTQGTQTILGRLAYVYDGMDYSEAAKFGRVFSVTAAGGGGGPGGGTASVMRREVFLYQNWINRIGTWLPPSLGGWTVDVHHTYDLIGETLFLGNGDRHNTEGLGQVVNTVAGNGTGGFSGDGGLAINAQLNLPRYVVADPDGSFYILDKGNGRIRKVDPNGIITTIAGGGSDSDSEGIPATSAQLGQVDSLALGPDGSLYIGESGFTRVRRVAPDGTIATFAGGKNRQCITDFSGTVILCGAENVPATDPSFLMGRAGFTLTVAVGPDGTVYIADNYASRIWGVGTDGIVFRVAGVINIPLASMPLNEGGLANEARVGRPVGLTVDLDGRIYVSTGFSLVRRIEPNGIIHTAAGQSGSAGYNGDGQPATSAQLNQPQGLGLDKEGRLYINDSGNRRIRRIGRDGIITTVAGDGISSSYGGDGGLALRAAFNYGRNFNMAVAPDGGIYLADNGNSRVRKITPPFQNFEPGDFILPAEDGSELYRFSSIGRHLETLDPLTGAVRLTFGYAPNSLMLSTITDADNNVTTIERDGSGTPTAVVAPGGQRTVLAMNANGFLASLANPAQETHRFSYTADGLMTNFTDPRGNSKPNTYDSTGFLTRHEDAAGGFTSFTRTELPNGWQVDKDTAENRTSSFTVERLLNGNTRRTITDQAGLTTTYIINQNGMTTITDPNGTVTTALEGPDSRFGMQAPILSTLTLTTPGSLTSTLSMSRVVTLNTPSDPLSMQTQTDTLVINGRTYTSLFDQTARLLTTSTPENRSSKFTLDVQGRILIEELVGLEANRYSYNAKGQVESITQGNGITARSTTLTYNTKNELMGILDPENRQFSFEYDDAGRIRKQILPGFREVLYGYDANGNVTSITPPGRPPHIFDFSSVNLEENFSPPDAGFTPKNTQYTFNKDRQLDLVTRPDGEILDFVYDSAGRLENLIFPGTQLTYAYDIASGNLTGIVAPDVTLSYSFDGSLLTDTTWAGTVSGSVGRGYDNNFRITSQTVNGANAISYSYDNDGLLTTVGDLTITRGTQHGLVTNSNLGVVSDTLAYNPFGEPEHYTAEVGGSEVFDTQFTRDKLGRITQKIEAIQGVIDTYNYTYDLAGRLTEVKKNGIAIESYSYDTNGNQLTFTDGTVSPAITVSGTYDSQDRMLTYGDLQFTYSNNGELKTKTNALLSQTANFSYDVLGNLKNVTLPNGDLIEYVIDGQNRRVGKKINGVQVQGFLYQNQLNPIAELDGSGNVISRFVYGTKPNVPDYLLKGGATYRMVSDHLGSVRLVIDASTGNIVQQIAYNSFGDILQNTNPEFQPFGFAGGLYDSDTGLTRFGVRDYESQTGRWTAKDPIFFDGGDKNLYRYTFSDPQNLIDPAGTDIITLGAGFSAFLGPLGEVGPVIGKEVTIGIGVDTHTGELLGFQTIGVADPNNPNDQGTGISLGAGISVGRFAGCKDEFFGPANEETVVLGPFGVAKTKTKSGKEGRNLSLGKGVGMSSTDITTVTTPFKPPLFF